VKKITALAGDTLHGPYHLDRPNTGPWWVSGVMYVADTEYHIINRCARLGFPVEHVDHAPSEYNVLVAAMKARARAEVRPAVAMRDAAAPGALNYTTTP
jgi:hypothetical protein